MTCLLARLTVVCERRRHGRICAAKALHLGVAGTSSAALVGAFELMGVRDPSKQKRSTRRAGLGLARLKKFGWIEGLGPGSRLEIHVREPSTVHSLTVQQLHRWVDGVTMKLVLGR